MSDYSDLKAQIMDWTNRQDFSDALVTSFIRQAEQIFNQDLRVDRMIQNDSALITARCAPLPDDWLQMDLVKIQNDNGADAFLPIRYKARDEFFNLRDNWSYGYYTIEGRQIYFGGSPDTINGVQYKIAYYGEVPALADDTQSFIYTKYPSLYLNAAIYRAGLHAVGEESTAAVYKQLTDETITKLNADHLRSKASGSRVTRSRVRSFG
jgi:hypothetical protein